MTIPCNTATAARLRVTKKSRRFIKAAGVLTSSAPLILDRLFSEMLPAHERPEYCHIFQWTDLLMALCSLDAGQLSMRGPRTVFVVWFAVERTVSCLGLL